MNELKASITIMNTPDDLSGYKYVIVTYCNEAGEYPFWYYGATNNIEEADRIANTIGGFWVKVGE